VIDGGCPLMFEPTADPGHKVMRFLFTMNGKVPRTGGAMTGDAPSVQPVAVGNGGPK